MGFDYIKAKKGIVRLAYQGKVRYGLWEKGEVRLYAGSPLANGVSQIRSYEERIVSEELSVVGLGVWGQRYSQAVDEPDIGQLR